MSPELFFGIDLAANTSVAWSRKFELLETK